MLSFAPGDPDAVSQCAPITMISSGRPVQGSIDEDGGGGP
jgi:hypothetical protein